MTFQLTPEEIAMFDNAPEDDLVDLAIDLDVAVPDEIIRANLVNACVKSLRDLAQREGLPFSAYDADDLDALSQDELDGVARLCGIEPAQKPETIERMLKAGKKVYKIYRKHRTRSQVPLYLPMLLAPLARLVASGEDGQ